MSICQPSALHFYPFIEHAKEAMQRNYDEITFSMVLFEYVHMLAMLTTDLGGDLGI